MNSADPAMAFDSRDLSRSPAKRGGDEGLPQLPIKAVTYRDLLRPEVLANPYPLFRRLRHEDPIHEDPVEGGWMVSRYGDIATVLSDPRFSAERLLPRDEKEGAVNPVKAALARQMLFLDPPDHTRLRRLFGKAFSTVRLENLRAPISELVTGLLDAAEGRRRANRFHPELRGSSPGECHRPDARRSPGGPPPKSARGRAPSECFSVDAISPPGKRWRRSKASRLSSVIFKG